MTLPQSEKREWLGDRSQWQNITGFSVSTPTYTHKVELATYLLCIKNLKTVFKMIVTFYIFTNSALVIDFLLSSVRPKGQKEVQHNVL